MISFPDNGVKKNGPDARTKICGPKRISNSNCEMWQCNNITAQSSQPHTRKITWSKTGKARKEWKLVGENAFCLQGCLFVASSKFASSLLTRMVGTSHGLSVPGRACHYAMKIAFQFSLFVASSNFLPSGIGPWLCEKVSAGAGLTPSGPGSQVPACVQHPRLCVAWHLSTEHGTALCTSLY